MMLYYVSHYSPQLYRSIPSLSPSPSPSPSPSHTHLFLLHFSLLKPIIITNSSHSHTTFFTNRRKSFRNQLSSSNSSINFDDELVENDVDIEIIKLSKNSRRITCRIAINANLQTVWNLLTDYEKLADFIPGLAVCQLLEKTANRARLFQIGQQNLAFGLKFNAKGIVDCYEKDLETIPFGQRRDIEFKMIEGDFQVFEGKWSIEEMNNESQEVIKSSREQEFQTVLSYAVDVKPKLWLPVRLVEGRLCREIKVNLLSVKKQAQKVIQSELHSC